MRREVGWYAQCMEQAEQPARGAAPCSTPVQGVVVGEQVNDVCMQDDWRDEAPPLPAAYELVVLKQQCLCPQHTSQLELLAACSACRQ